MNRKLILLNIALGGSLIWIGVQLREHWLESSAREQAALARQAKAVPVTPPASVPAVDPASPAAYIEVAQQTLFSKDRDPNVIIDVAPPPPPPPEPPVPPLPKYHGQMSFGQPVLVLSTEKTPQKSYHKGETVGDFEIAEFDRDTVTFLWNNKKLKHDLSELKPKESERVVQAATPLPAAAATAAPPKPTALPPRGEAMLGKANGAIRACVANDNTPDGTVVAGYRKVVAVGLMGASCHWEPIR